jgi:hypothetical protein
MRKQRNNDPQILNMICIFGVWVWVVEYYEGLRYYQTMMKGERINVRV